MPTDKNVWSTLVVVVDCQINAPLGKDKSAQVAKDRQKEKQHRNEFSYDAQIMTEVPKDTHITTICHFIGRKLPKSEYTISTEKRQRNCMSLQVVQEAEHHTEKHLTDSKYHRDLLLEGIRKCYFVGGHHPNLTNQRKDHQLFKMQQSCINKKAKNTTSFHFKKPQQIIQRNSDNFKTDIRKQ